MKVKFVNVREALTPSGLPDVDWAFNPYVGCAHACVYCYGRCYTRDKEVAGRWGEVVAVKSNVIGLLKREVRRKRGVVGVGTVTDPYQPLEAAHGLTREGLRVLIGGGLEVSLQTKSDLVLRDLDLLLEAPERVDVGVTVTTLDEGLAGLLEPNAPSPKARVRALERLSGSGVRTWVFLGPIVPGYNDDLASIRAVVEMAASTGSALYYDKLRVKRFMLAPAHPLREAAERARSYRWGELFRRIEDLCRSMGVKCALGLDYGRSREVREGSARLDSFL